MKTLLRILILVGAGATAFGFIRPAFDGPFPPPCLPPAVCQK